jgi:hypothetical protein
VHDKDLSGLGIAGKIIPCLIVVSLLMIVELSLKYRHSTLLMLSAKHIGVTGLFPANGDGGDEEFTLEKGRLQRRGCRVELMPSTAPPESKRS